MFAKEMLDDQRKWQEAESAKNRRWQLQLAAIVFGFTLLNGAITWLFGFLLR